MTQNITVDEAAVRAQRAFEAAEHHTPKVRAGWLSAIAASLEESSDELVTLAVEETHLPVGRLRGEVVRTVFQLRLLAEESSGGYHLDAVIDHADPSWPMGARPDLRRVNQPLGVVGVFGASNFPFAFGALGGDTASGLAAGCAVIHKTHPGHPRLSQRTIEIALDALRRAGAPDDLLSLVEGYDAGLELVDHPLVKAIGFTGSTRAGRALFDRAVSRPEPIPFFGELGSSNPVFVTRAAWRARKETILEGFATSVGLGMGQFCTKPGYLIVPTVDPTELETALLGPSQQLARHPLLTPSLRDGFDRAVREFSDSSEVQTLVTLASQDDTPGLIFLKIDATDVLANPPLFNRELFGPASVVITYDNINQLTALAELADGQLTTSVHAEVDEDIENLIEVLRAKSGRIIFNGWPTGVTVTYAQQHGGPYPATTAPASTSVGTAAISRFMRPVAFQDFPQIMLPEAVRDDNPWAIPQRVDGVIRTVEK
jgi:NADP-dependent aldehyde dehydrogenase